MADLIDTEFYVSAQQRIPSAIAPVLAQQEATVTTLTAERDRARNDLADALDMKRGQRPSVLTALAAERDRARKIAFHMNWCRSCAEDPESARDVECQEMAQEIASWPK